MRVRDIMTKNVATASLDSTLEDVASMMKEDDTGAIPVVDDGELAGIVTDRDIVIRCIAEGKDPSDTTVEEILTEELHTIEPDADIDDAALIMSERQIRRLPVVEEGELVGVISLGDIAVNQGNTDTAGETLQDISQGVKQDGKRSPQRGVASRTQAVGRAAGVSARGRTGQAEGRTAKVTPIRQHKHTRTGRRKTG